MTDIKFTIDGRPVAAKPGQTIVEAAREAGIYIPVLCNSEGSSRSGPAGSVPSA